MTTAKLPSWARAVLFVLICIIAVLVAVVVIQRIQARNNAQKEVEAAHKKTGAEIDSLKAEKSSKNEKAENILDRSLQKAKTIKEKSKQYEKSPTVSIDLDYSAKCDSITNYRPGYKAAAYPSAVPGR